MPRHYCTLFAEEDRAPQALLAAPPTQLLMGVEDMQRAFWQGTDQGRGMLHQVRGEAGLQAAWRWAGGERGYRGAPGAPQSVGQNLGT